MAQPAKVHPGGDDGPPDNEGNTFKCSARVPACYSCEKHITVINDDNIVLKRSIPFATDTVNLRTSDVSLVRTATNDVSVFTLLKTVGKPFFVFLVILILGVELEDQKKLVLLGIIGILLCIVYVCMKQLGTIVEFGGDESAYQHTMLPRAYAEAANNWAKIPPKRRKALVDAFIETKSKDKPNTGQADTVITGTSRVGPCITAKCTVTVGQHTVRILNEGGYCTPCGRPEMMEEMAFAVDDVEWINVQAGAESAEPLLALVVGAIFYLLELGGADTHGGDDTQANVIIGFVVAAIIYLVTSMRSGAAVEFALRGGVHASAMINSISTRRKLTKLVNARQTGQEQQDAALQVWKGQQPGKPKSKDDKSYEQIELHSHSLEYNAISVGCACGPCKCCKGEKYSWNIVLKHVHSIQTKYAGDFKWLLWSALFFIALIYFVFIHNDNGDIPSWVPLALLGLSLLMILIYYKTKVGCIFIGTIQLDRSKTQPPLALMFNGSEKYLNDIVSAIRTQQATNLMGGAPAPTVAMVQPAPMVVQPVAAGGDTLPV